MDTCKRRALEIIAEVEGCSVDEIWQEAAAILIAKLVKRSDINALITELESMNATAQVEP